MTDDRGDEPGNAHDEGSDNRSHDHSEDHDHARDDGHHHADAEDEGHGHTADDGHGHDHADGHAHSEDETAADPRPRVRAIQSLLVEKGVVTVDAIDEAIAAYERDVGPLNGARVVARAWTDAAFKERLLDDANEALDEFDFEVGVQHIEVKENTDDAHNAVVCTLCSCYPWSLLGLPPTWYKTSAYRSRMVREPRAVLGEFGLELADDVSVNVWDSSSEIRYMVLPRRPDGTDGYDEAELVDVVTRDSMIGVERLDAAPATDGGRRAAANGPGHVDAFDALAGHEDGPTFSAPWQARAFGLAVALRDGDGFEWSAFQRQLVEEVNAPPTGGPDRAADIDDRSGGDEGDDADGNREHDVETRDGVVTAAERTYYGQFVTALERLLVDRGTLRGPEVDDRAAEFADGARTAEEFVEGDRGH